MSSRVRYVALCHDRPGPGASFRAPSGRPVRARQGTPGRVTKVALRHVRRVRSCSVRPRLVVARPVTSCRVRHVLPRSRVVGIVSRRPGRARSGASGPFKSRKRPIGSCHVRSCRGRLRRVLPGPARLARPSFGTPSSAVPGYVGRIKTCRSQASLALSGQFLACTVLAGPAPQVPPPQGPAHQAPSGLSGRAAPWPVGASHAVPRHVRSDPSGRAGSSHAEVVTSGPAGQDAPRLGRPGHLMPSLAQSCPVVPGPVRRVESSRGLDVKLCRAVSWPVRSDPPPPLGGMKGGRACYAGSRRVKSRPLMSCCVKSVPSRPVRSGLGKSSYVEPCHVCHFVARLGMLVWVQFRRGTSDLSCPAASGFTKPCRAGSGQALSGRPRLVLSSLGAPGSVAAGQARSAVSDSATSRPLASCRVRRVRSSSRVFSRYVMSRTGQSSQARLAVSPQDASGCIASRPASRIDSGRAAGRRAWSRRACQVRPRDAALGFAMSRPARPFLPGSVLAHLVGASHVRRVAPRPVSSRPVAACYARFDHVRAFCRVRARSVRSRSATSGKLCPVRSVQVEGCRVGSRPVRSVPVESSRGLQVEACRVRSSRAMSGPSLSRALRHGV
jgi:hypothetical protein